MRKVLLATLIGTAIVLSGCSADKDPMPTPVPTVSTLPSTTISGWPTPPNITRPAYDPTQTANPDPEQTTRRPADPDTKQPETIAPSSTGAITPAVAFAQRWGKKYPDVPEFAILKAANATCKLIETSGVNWNDNPLTTAAIESAVGAAGLSENDALEFAQDANQNYCSSVNNPT